MKIVASIIALFIISPAFCQEGIEKHYKIYDVKTKLVVPIENIAIAMDNANVLFFGEEHNDSAGHYLEAAIAKQLFDRFAEKFTVSMEMFETDCQVPLNEYLHGFISEERFTKEARAWGNYKDYKPVVELAKINHLDVIAANTPRRYVNMVSRKGMRSLDSLPKESKKFLPRLPYDTATGPYRDKFMEFMKGGSPGTDNARIFHSQSLWDAGMANSIYLYWKKQKAHKIFHLVGRFHSDEKLGTAAQLQSKKSKLKILNISCFSDPSFSNPDWEKFNSLADFVILTDPDLKKTF